MPRQRQQAAQNTGFNSAACAVELHEPARVDEPVHDSRRHLVVADPAATSPGTPSANLIEMDRSYYASIEVGQRNVNLSNLNKIADGFHITISELMRGVEQMILI